MCERGLLIVAFDKVHLHALVARGNCDCWSCAECADRKRQEVLIRMQIGITDFRRMGLRVDFVTMTSHENLKSFESTWAVWQKAWVNLKRALSRKTTTFEYVLVPERHKDGRLHMHGIWTAAVSKSWLKDNTRTRGLGYQADVKEISDASTAGKYVAKYLTKSVEGDYPAHFRRVRWSNGWAVMPKPVSELSAFDWQLLGSEKALRDLYYECEHTGYTIINVRTGAVWDDLDHHWTRGV